MFVVPGGVLSDRRVRGISERRGLLLFGIGPLAIGRWLAEAPGEKSGAKEAEEAVETSEFGVWPWRLRAHGEEESQRWD